MVRRGDGWEMKNYRTNHEMNYKDAAWLQQKYWDEGLSVQAVAELAGMSHRTIEYWMQKLGVPVRTRSEATAGERHPMWGKKHTLESRQKMRRSAIALKRTGENSPTWNGGVRGNNGYIMRLNRNHPNADSHGYVMEHRLVMEECLGRPLEPWEVVHHINGVKDDNRPENLKLFSHQGEHLATERLSRAYEELLVENERLKRENQGIFAEIFDGLDQLLEAAGQLKAANKYKTNYVPAIVIWEAKEDGYKEIANLVAMIAKCKQPYPETGWSWKE